MRSRIAYEWATFAGLEETCCAADRNASAIDAHAPAKPLPGLVIPEICPVQRGKVPHDARLRHLNEEDYPPTNLQFES